MTSTGTPHERAYSTTDAVPPLSVLFCPSHTAKSVSQVETSFVCRFVRYPVSFLIGHDVYRFCSLHQLVKLWRVVRFDLPFSIVDR